MRWCYKDIMRQILPHPRKRHVDSVLANIKKDIALNEGDQDAAESGNHADLCHEETTSEGGCSKGEDSDADESCGNEQDLEE